MSTVAHHHSIEEDRRHHQTAPLSAFGPSVLVTAAATTNTPNLNPSSSSCGKNGGGGNAKCSANATPMVRHHTATEDVHQRSPLRAFEPTNAAGTSASHNNTPLRSRSPVAGNLKLSFGGGVDMNDLPTVGSSASENVTGSITSNTNKGGSPAAADASGDIAAQKDGALHSSSSNYPLYDYESMNDVSDHPKHQVKPLHNAKSPRGHAASHH